MIWWGTDTGDYLLTFSQICCWYSMYGLWSVYAPNPVMGRDSKNHTPTLDIEPKFF